VNYAPAAAPIVWTRIDSPGFELAFYAPVEDEGTRDPRALGYVRFGDSVTAGTSETAPGDIRVRIGTRLKVPQGFRRFYFRSDLARYGWGISIVRLPNLEIIPQPQADAKIMRNIAELAYADAAPTLTTEGLALPAQVRRVAIHLVTSAGPARLAQTVTCEVWWLNFNNVWCHNPADDFDAGGLGDADASHDVEVYDVQHGALSVYIRRTNSATGWSAYIGAQT
jgi:hypothetical protein